MKCKYCKKPVHFANRIYLNLETYKPGGTVLAASECCDQPYLVTMRISYVYEEYKGDAKEDDWGVNFANKLNE